MYVAHVEFILFDMVGGDDSIVDDVVNGSGESKAKEELVCSFSMVGLLEGDEVK